MGIVPNRLPNFFPNTDLGAKLEADDVLHPPLPGYDRFPDRFYPGSYGGF